MISRRRLVCGRRSEIRRLIGRVPEDVDMVHILLAGTAQQERSDDETSVFEGYFHGYTRYSGYRYKYTIR